MVDDNTMLEKIKSLSLEIEELKNRVAVLEDVFCKEEVPVNNHATDIPVVTAASINVQKNPVKTEIPNQVRPSGSPNLIKENLANKFNETGLENIIGGTWLNRIGIIVIFFGAAYFLKYSFDNKWIGELARIIIGYISGIALIACSELVLRRKYSYFAQGFTGGGIGIIYLTTFAAVNFYHLMYPSVAFAVMVFTAFSGGILAVHNDGYSIAVLSALGGFLTPFLIGSTEARPLLLLSYIAALNLAVLYLAYNKNWRSLNLLAFFSTALVYTVYHFNAYSVADKNLWLNQVFLTIYFIIFGTLSFFYNIRHNEKTSARDIALLLLNAAFFYISASNNLDNVNEDWLDLLAVTLALVYMALAVFLHKRKLGDRLLFLTILGTGIAFATIAVPLLFDQNWTYPAWATEALVLVYAGIKGGNIWVRRAGLILLSLVGLEVFTRYPYFLKSPFPVLNHYSITACLATIGFYFVAHMYFHRPEMTEKERFKVWPAAIIATVLAIKEISWEVTNFLDYFNINFSYNFSVSMAWVLFAVFLLLLGMKKDIKGFRYISLSLFGLTTVKVMLFDLSGLAMIYRVLILFIVGIVLVGVSFVYQKRDRTGGD
ncbi:membrane protein-like protein [Desulfofarcimen acetoxidans DSM 771]|uniref:Membrane protein-like protein n=1 Tax=Desulfofarcimen acetoxidans (strain ATCC 49208 / DSM 771 / KCTC 5769 / VKM B-1644 / 5575) TaxID=485916 RepID=C8VWG8_DESAS|nr:DUF2339 domain-containing protein [Desulfofarcimen acetoxidans]ACV62520.1 membrane protein-like protein [Desulfofarcimen acetoxidans DSM 771]